MSCISSRAGLAGQHVIANQQTLTLADVFAEDSECERTFYGFSDDEISQQQKHDERSSGEDEAQLDLSPKEQKATSKPSSAANTFKLRIALRSHSSIQRSSGEEEEEEDEDEEEQEEQQQPTKRRGVAKKAQARPAKRMRHVRFEDEEAAVVCPSPTETHGSDSADDEADTFLAKRQQNIKANKAMLAQLMADLQKMPGGAGFLKKQASKQKTKERSSRPPRSGGEPRKLPERASRRLTRSMGGAEEPTPKEEELELSLEEELLEVRRAPQRRGGPRPNMSKPHVVRPVEDITEDELQLIAENMTDKIYNRVTGSTCHQCRQKTIDTKTHCRREDCRGIQGQFCGPCLRNRYGEDVKKALLDPEWKCPPCRGICNCSFCRQREGRCPTGILFPLAQYHGFSDVHSYLSSLRNKLKKEEDEAVEM